LSDMHNMIGFQLKYDVPNFSNKWIKYRSFKNFDYIKIQITTIMLMLLVQ
jgi:hypothetical protein